MCVGYHVAVSCSGPSSDCVAAIDPVAGQWTHHQVKRSCPDAIQNSNLKF